MAEKQTQGKPFSSNKEALYGAFAMLVEHLLKDTRYYSDLAKVVSIDEDNKTATVKIVNGEELPNVRLQQVASDSGLFLYPKVGSAVLVSWTDNTTAYISLYSEIDKIVFQGGKNGGLTITPLLVENLDKNNELIQSLINVISGTPIPEPGNGAVSAFQTALAGAITGQSLGDFSEIENENFTH